jgi:DNA modification methylase
MANFNNERGTELIWQGKYDKDGKLNLPERISWPFQTIETVNESKFDREKQRDLFYQKKESSPWRNRLIWGDNKYIMSSLLEEFAGKIDLIYIDPPFATGADFSYKVDIGDAELVKEPSMLEEIAYRDTWGKGYDSFISMMYERLIFMHHLLSNSGSIYVHCDWRVNNYIKLILEEIFGKDNLVNQITWKRTFAHGDVGQGAQHLGRISDTIFLVRKSENSQFNLIYSSYDKDYVEKVFNNIDSNGRRWQSVSLTAPGGSTKGNPYFEFLGIKRYWQYSKDNLEKLLKEGKIYQANANTVPRRKMYLDESKGVPLQDLWLDIVPVQGQALENVKYPTQKPEKLLERIIQISTKEVNLVADFFCGSGTTGVVAEKLGRRWIMTDLSRFAIQTTRKRLLQIENCSPFIIQNLGKYERQYWYSTFGAEGINKRQEYINTILKFYKAQPVTGFQNIHGTKNNRVVFVGELDIPVTLNQIEDVAKECLSAKQNKLDILGWEYEMGLDKETQGIINNSGVDIRLLKIPKEVMDPKYEGKIDFYDLGVLDLEISIVKRNVELQIKQFYIPHLELVKEEEIREKIKNWSDFIDYWAIDFNYRDDNFHNEWQDFRTKNTPKLNLRANSKDSAEDKTTYYKASGKYKILVKVLDIFGNDTTKIIEVEIV